MAEDGEEFGILLDDHGDFHGLHFCFQVDWAFWVAYCSIDEDNSRSYKEAWRVDYRGMADWVVVYFPSLPISPFPFLSPLTYPFMFHVICPDFEIYQSSLYLSLFSCIWITCSSLYFSMFHTGGEGFQFYCR